MNQAKLKATELLKSGAVDRVIGWTEGDFAYDCSPATFTIDNIDKFVYTEFCGANLSKYLIEESKKEGKILVFLKPCDTYSFNQLIQEHRIKRENIYVVGIECQGKVDIDKLRAFGVDGVLGAKADGDKLIVDTIYGEKIVIRIYNALGDEIKLANLTKNKRDEAVMRKMINSPHGIILLTGPTGSGKTTTLYSFLKELNTEDVNITTIEDPVENQIKGVNQVQVNTKTGLTFAYTLRSILRQDPDIIMVGEIRDEETAHIAVQAAITGHLVLSTIHTNDAVTTITRLVDMGVEPYLVADSLIGAISQRLVRRLCNHCKKEHIVNAQEAKDLCDITEGTKVFEPCGCPHCNNTGYAGRAPVMEILPIDDDMKQAIDQKIQEFTIEKVKKVFIEKKYDTLKKACSRLVADGTTSIEEYRKLVEFTGQDHTY